MLTRIAMAVVLAGLVLPALAADKDDVVREIPIKLEREVASGAVDKPTVITSEAELAKAIPEKDVQAKVAKDVDFKTHKLLFFVWTGSGTDKLTPTAEKNKVVFGYTPGVTDDVKKHFRLFALSKDASWQVAK
jgi:hypothetical protein